MKKLIWILGGAVQTGPDFIAAVIVVPTAVPHRFGFELLNTSILTLEDR